MVSKVFIILLTTYLFVWSVNPIWARSLIIRAIYPAPADGEFEWVLLENLEDTSISLQGLAVSDAVGKVVIASLSGTLAAKTGYFVTASVSGITLNNAGDAVRLWQGSEMVEQSESYLDAPKGKVWYYDGEEWSWRTGSRSGTSFVPDQVLFHGETNAEESTNITFNQERTREEFFSALSDEEKDKKSIPEEEKENILLYKGKFVTPIFWQSIDNSAKNQVRERFGVPEPDWTRENDQAREWLQAGQLAITACLFASICWLSISLPFWWEWWQTKVYG